MTLTIIANWKMNLSLSEAEVFCQALEQAPKFKNKLIIAPPIPYLAYITKTFPTLAVAAQNVSTYHDYGSYTGEYSAKILKSCNVKYAIIGHPERRKLFNEDTELLRNKVENCIRENIVPILCITEHSLSDISILPDYIEKAFIAYEPSWAIGTGNTPSNADIINVFSMIRSSIPESIEKKIKLVYGGSVDATNCAKFFNLPGLDGLLIGSASLNEDTLRQILNLK